jgi:hypothetical protein
MFFDPSPEIMERAKNASATDDAALDRIATKLLKAKGLDDAAIVPQLAVLAVEIQHFQRRTGPFVEVPKIWVSPLLQEGKIAEWHATHVIKITEVLGFLGARTTGKLLGIGSAERNWGEYKRANNKFRPMDAETAEKQTLIFGAAHMSDVLGSQAKVWTEKDMQSDVGLEKFQVQVDMDATRVPTREFNNYIEDWEAGDIKINKAQSETKLLEKYKLIRFYDPDFDDGTTFTIIADNLDWKKGRGGGWQVIAEPDADDDAADDADDEDEDEDESNKYEPYLINEALHDMIRECDTQTKGVVLKSRPADATAAP